MTLTPEQTHALFDMLTHHETYREIESFKFPDAVTGYGYHFARETVVPQGGWKSAATTPVNSRPGTPRPGTPVPSVSAPASVKDEDEDEDEDEDGSSTSPVLQTLLARFVLRLPGARDLPRDFWAVRVQGLLARLGAAELSESFDKGVLGTRKVLATGASGLLEMIARGAFGGVKRKRTMHGDGETKATDSYDRTKAEDLERAWDDIVDGLIYGGLVDEAFDHLSKTDDLESLSPATKAAAEYAIVHLATFLHHIFVLSPEGQYLLKLIENVHNLVPYKMVKQTLRVGNAATMISGMMRLLLAKLSVTSVTNWIGLTANADDGMNLLQRIISLVLSWDAGEFRKSADNVQKAKYRPSDEMLEAIRQHISRSREEHETVRKASEEQAQSIITAILNASNAHLATALTEETHAQCLEYYSALLSVRDRDSITTAFCRQPPDLFTAAMKDLIAAYEPLIRTVHAGIDLREHVEAGQAFIDDFIRSSKPKKPQSGSKSNGDVGKMPSVDDYVELLMRNRAIMYRWVHSLAAKCPDIWRQMRAWTKEAVVRFRQDRVPVPVQIPDETATEGVSISEDAQKGAAEKDLSAMDSRLSDLFQSLPEAKRTPIITALEAHSEYLSNLANLSHTRLQGILDSRNPTMAGPGMYLSRWQSLLDRTPISPATPKGEIRRGKDVKHELAIGKTVVPGAAKAREAAHVELGESIEAPDVDVVIQELGPGFRELVQELGGR